jgi:hypothetical protein
MFYFLSILSVSLIAKKTVTESETDTNMNLCQKETCKIICFFHFIKFTFILVSIFSFDLKISAPRQIDIEFNEKQTPCLVLIPAILDVLLQVRLRCGLKNEVTDVDEPSRCE